MRKLIIAAALMFFVSTPAYAFLGGDTTNNSGIMGDKNHHNTIVNGGVTEVGDVDIKNKNKNTNTNTNTNVNTNLNSNSNRNYNTNKNEQDQSQGQAQGQIQGQAQGQKQGIKDSANNAAFNNMTIEDEREFANGVNVPVAPVVNGKVWMSDADIVEGGKQLMLMKFKQFKNRHWNNLRYGGDYKVTVNRVARARKVTVDPDAIIEIGPMKGWFAGQVTVVADADGTNALMVLAEAMDEAARIGGTAVSIVSTNFEFVQTSKGFTIGFNTTGAGSHRDGGVTGGGGPGYTSVEGAMEGRPYIVLIVTHN